MSEPDLFVVCKNCSSEVSPYVTECPYCGQRVRKRAPKIERQEGEAAPRVRRTRLPRLRRDEIPGIAPDVRPVTTIALIVLALAATVARATGEVSLYDMGSLEFSGDDSWRLLTTAFLYDNAGHQFIALVTIGIFGTHLERRFGPLTAPAIFILAGGGGAALALALDTLPALGGNGAALGLLAAWLVEDRLARRRGDDRENDLLGVYLIAVLLLLVPLADESASAAAGAGGLAAGAAAGLVLSVFRR